MGSSLTEIEKIRPAFGDIYEKAAATALRVSTIEFRMPAMKHRGQHFVVTGAGSGIGRAIALRLAADGASLSLFGRRTGPLRETEQLAVAAGAPDPFVVSCDVSDRQAISHAVAQAAIANGPLRGLIANAGVGGTNKPGEDDRWDELLGTNLSGTYYSFRAAAEHFVSGTEARHLIAISSILGRIGVPHYTGYCASKTGILGLVRALAAELASDNVQVNAVCPGWVDTEMAWDGIEGMAKGMQVSKDQAYAAAMSAVPMGRMSKPEDVAGLVSWLASSESRGVTGQGLDMNGGAYMI
jgi:NAD(P)-dependent dehydrogenase (short-subunit alcohol dehydrogenase family)